MKNLKKQILAATAFALMLGVWLGRSDGQGATPGLQGSWTVVSVTDSGKSQPVPKGSSAAFTMDKFSMKEGKTTIDYAYKIDASKSPKWIDLAAGDAMILGIYEIKGDTLQICMNSPGGKRATRFESKDKTENDILMVFKRAK